MRIIHMMKERGGSELREYKTALKTLKEAKDAIDTICELTEDMEEEYSERGDYGDRYHPRHYYRRDHDWDDMDERRYRDSMGRYR